MTAAQTGNRRDMQFLQFDRALLPDGWADNVRIGIAEGKVVSVERDAIGEAADERHAIAIPGMPNLHSHAFQRGMAGLAETRGPTADSFWSWREIMYRFVARLDPESLQAIAAMAYCEMLESGFTRVGEFHYLHHDPDGNAYSDPAELSRAIFAASMGTGIALTHLPVFYAHAGFGGTAPSDGQRRFVNDIDGFARLLESVRSAAASMPDCVVGLAPHSLRAATPEEIAALEKMAGSGPIHIHIAEQVKEVEDCQAWSGLRPVDWLLDNAPVDERWCLVHATHVTDSEVVGIAKSGAVVGLCPVTEANLGDGLFPAADYRTAGGNFGIGSDSNVLIDMTEELRLLEYGQRLMRRERNVMANGSGRSTGAALFDACLAGGAQALGDRHGLRPGASADIVSLDARHVSLQSRPVEALLDALVFAAGRSAVDCVWRGGRRVVSGGRHVSRDAVEREYRAALRTILA